jgi:hypothetical protein
MNTVAGVTQQQRLRLAKREAAAVRRLARTYAELTRWCSRQSAALSREVAGITPRPSAGQIMELPSYQAFARELRARLRLAALASSLVIRELEQDGQQLGVALAEAELTAVLGADRGER